MDDLYDGLERYFQFYDNERRHQALDYRTPHEVYQESVALSTQLPASHTSLTHTAQRSLSGLANEAAFLVQFLGSTSKPVRNGFQSLFCWIMVTCPRVVGSYRSDTAVSILVLLDAAHGGGGNHFFGTRCLVRNHWVTGCWKPECPKGGTDRAESLHWEGCRRSRKRAVALKHKTPRGEREVHPET